MTLDLFDHYVSVNDSIEFLAPGALVLRNFVLSFEKDLLKELDQIVAAAPFRHMTTPGGFTMSVGMTNCGNFGWVSDSSGYRYDARDPLNDQQWPPIPASFIDIANTAAAQAGYHHFEPDACLINCYLPGAKMSLHQDKDEHDLSQPIVSVSMGIPAVFLFCGFKRNDKTKRTCLCHGDVVVWGGPSRLRFHGVLPVKDNDHPTLGKKRINLTFRKIT